MQHVHASETGADDHRIEHPTLARLQVPICHSFSDDLLSDIFPIPLGVEAMIRPRRVLGNLFRRHSVRNRGATGKRVMPVLGDYELSAVQELGSIQKSPGKSRAIEYRFEEPRA